MNSKRAYAYDMIDRFLRNNLDDTEYEEYSAALELIYATPHFKAVASVINEKTDYVSCGDGAYSGARILTATPLDDGLILYQRDNDGKC